MDQQPGYNPYSPQPSAPSQDPYAPPPSPYGPPPAGGTGFNPYAPPTAGAEAPVYGVDTQMHVLAGRGTRLGAHIVDSLLYAGSIIPGAILLGIGAGNNQDVAIGLGAALMGLCALGFLIFQVYLISTSGQSLGKRWLGIKIVKVDGTEPGFVHGWLLRGFLMYILTTVLNVATMVLGSVLGLVNVLMIFGDERRCLHDHIAGTKVIIAGQ